MSQSFNLAKHYASNLKDLLFHTWYLFVFICLICAFLKQWFEKVWKSIIKLVVIVILCWFSWNHYSSLTYEWPIKSEYTFSWPLKGMLKSVNILRWVAWRMGQTNRRPRVWCSKYFFYTFYRLRALKTFYFYFCNFIKGIRK